MLARLLGTDGKVKSFSTIRGQFFQYYLLAHNIYFSEMDEHKCAFRIMFQKLIPWRIHKLNNI
jgi:hypothetical protein